ncbi:MAG TPA: hypothetical protein VL947_06790 [Cytophagales bacterium]|nr:hypothetical protein [Cytophagales bacterium]
MLILLALMNVHAYAQNFSNALEYMEYISSYQRDITEDFLSYTSAVAHGKTARKIEKRRLELVNSVKDGKRKIAAMPAYQGDKALRDSATQYLGITYDILNDDYAKIVNMEEVAEQSYDAMEAYLLAQDLAGEKQDRAAASYSNSVEAFAKKNNITLLDEKSKFKQKVEKASKVNKYHREIYLIFFKSYKQELYLLDALDKKDFSAIEQNNNTLKQYAEEGIVTLAKKQAFEGKDNTLTQACRELLNFYKQEVTKTKLITDFMLKNESFTKLKSVFEAKSASERTKEDVDNYNKQIADLNKAVSMYNQTTADLNNSRSRLINNWNKASSNFLDNNTPKYNKK